MPIGNTTFFYLQKNAGFFTGSVADSLGSSWTLVFGGLTQITSGPYGVVYGVNSNDDIYCRTGITDSNPKGTGWKHIGGKLKYVSCGGLGCWGVNSGNQIFFRYGVSRQNPAGACLNLFCRIVYENET